MLLARRYQDDGRPALRLTAHQRASIAAFNAECAAAGAAASAPLPCVVCEGTTFDPVAEKDRYGIRHLSGICRECGHFQATAYYHPSLLDRFYTHFYRDIYGELTPPVTFERHRARGSEILAYVGEAIPSQANVLEVGCGTGGILQVFKDAGHRVSGIDMDEDFLAHGQSRGLDLSLSSLDDAHFERRFDLIILSHVLEHFVDPAAKLGKIRALLAEGGHLYVEVPSLHSCGPREGSDMLRYLQNAHVSNFTVESLANLFARAGFQVVRSDDQIRAVVRAGAARPQARIGAARTRAEIQELEREYRGAGPVVRLLRFAKRWRNRLSGRI